jgi:iron complex outermembrane receptor protein
MASSQNCDFRLRTLAATLALPLTVGSSYAAAQQAILEEVIVTAQKRSESVQDIPSTVNVIDGEALKEFNVFNFTDLGALSAGLEINSFNGRSGRINLRGIDYNPNSASEASVTTYWNQAIVDSNAVFQQMFDIQRIEVLRGPQGSLAGRTSPAGAINIHTARPNLEEMEGEIRGTFADNDGVNTQAAASFVLLPGELAVRVAGVYDESDLDEIENDVTGETTNDETKAGRVSLSWLPTDALSVDLAVQYLERENDDVITLEGAPAGDPSKQDPDGVLRELDAFDRRGAFVGLDNGIEDNTDGEFWNSSLVLQWELESHMITSVTGYHDTDSTREYDQALGNSNPENVARRIAVDERTDWSQELRIASEGGETWDYMLGAYYENSDVDFSQQNFPIPLAPLPPGTSSVLKFPAETDRWGLFTHNQFYLTDAWTLQVGLRYQEIDTDRDLSTVAGPDGAPGFEPGETLAQVLSEDEQNYDDDSVTGQITLQYALSDEWNLYALVGTGWRPGGVTVTPTVVPEDLLLFDSEDSTSYELGFKSTLMEGALRLNGSLYYQDYEDYISRQNAVSIRGESGQIDQSGLTVNGDAEVWGAEMDLTALLSENWYLAGSLSYSEGEYDDGTELPCNEFDDDGAPVIPEEQSVALCNVGGDALGASPEFTASINSEYSIPFDRVEGYGRILYTYTGERDSDIDGVDPYNIVNLYLGVREEQWNVELFATNLFDEEELRAGGGTETTPLVRREPTGYGQRFLVPGRRIGISASYRW